MGDNAACVDMKIGFDPATADYEVGSGTIAEALFCHETAIERGLKCVPGALSTKRGYVLFSCCQTGTPTINYL